MELYSVLPARCLPSFPDVGDGLQLLSKSKAMAICCDSLRDDSSSRTKSALSHMLRTPVRPWCLSINQVELHPVRLVLPFHTCPKFSDVRKEKDHQTSTDAKLANFWDLHRRLAEPLNGTTHIGIGLSGYLWKAGLDPDLCK